MSGYLRNVFFVLTLSVVFFLMGCMEQDDAAIRAKANKLAQKYTIVDTHLDTPYNLIDKMKDISVRAEGTHFDYPRARAGGLDTAFMVAYIPPGLEKENKAKAKTDELIALIQNEVAKNPDKFELAASSEEVKKQKANDKVTFVICIENGSAIEGDIENIKYFYDKGVRYITLCHSKCNAICDSSYDEERINNGLSAFGEKVVAEMNRLGMIIDVSHICDKSFWDVLKYSKVPVVATHSSCRYFTPDFERNMSDEMIKALAENGGVIQINFGSIFISGEMLNQLRERKKIIAEYIEANNLEGKAAEEYSEKYTKEHPVGPCCVSDVADHIDRVVELVGIDHVGIGSDYDGVEDLPAGLEDVSGYPNLIYELVKRGYSDSDIEKICSGNFLRVWSEIEKAAEAG